MAPTMDVTVWDEEQVVCDDPPTELALRLWAGVARALIGADATATVSIDCDDLTTEMRLRAAGFKVVEIDRADGGEPAEEEATTVEREGRLGDLLEAVVRLPPEGPLGALAIAAGRGADLDDGAGLDVWGPGAAVAVRRIARELGIVVRERPAEE